MKRFFLLFVLTLAFASNVYAESVQQTPTKVKFQSSAHIGTIFDAYGGGPTFDIDAGARMFNYLYMGVATGVHTYFAPSYYGTSWVGYVPIGVNLKGYFTKDKVVNPYVNCSLGGCIFVSGRGGGFHCQAGAGVEIKRFSLGVGYNGFIVNGVRGDSGYIKLGVRFGK